MSTPNFLRSKLLKSTSSNNDFLQTLYGVEQRTYFTKSKGNLYEFYLTGEITTASDYIDWFDCIRNASEADTIRIYINSPGGDLYTAIQFLRVMSESQAEIICSVEGACMSAATMIFLHGDIHEVTPHSTYMFHDYSSGVFGKGGEQYDQIQFERAWSERFLKEVYANFLTHEEIHSMLHNKDIWMTSDEVVARLNKLAKAQQQALDAESQED